MDGGTTHDRTYVTKYIIPHLQQQQSDLISKHNNCNELRMCFSLFSSARPHSDQQTTDQAKKKTWFQKFREN